MTSPLELPAPIFDAIDTALTWMYCPPLLRIALYAALCAWFGMLIYRRCSDQPRLVKATAEVARTRRALELHDADFAGLRPLIAAHLGAATRQLQLTLSPALLASLPLPFILSWLAQRFDSDLLHFGPEWLRTWELWFFAVLIPISALLKRRWRLY